jgi:hypothetical protein
VRTSSTFGDPRFLGLGGTERLATVTHLVENISFRFIVKKYIYSALNIKNLRLIVLHVLEDIAGIVILFDCGTVHRCIDSRNHRSMCARGRNKGKLESDIPRDIS